MSDLDVQPGRRLRWFSSIAFVLALTLVATRATMLETIRDDFVPGAPRGPGPIQSTILDWLSILPALFVLLRRALDVRFTLVFAPAHVLFGLLGVWAVASAAWSVDSYATLVSSTKLLAAASIGWTFTQTVRRWSEFRIVVGVLFGLLLINLAKSLVFHFDEHPRLVEQWPGIREQVFAQRGWTADSYAAQRFEQKLLAGEMMGFTTSANTFGATIVALVVTSISLIAHRIREKLEAGWTGLIAIGVAGMVWCLSNTQSRASVLALIAGIGILIVWRLTRKWLASHQGLVFAISVGLVLLGITSVVAIGLTSGGLPGDSVNFRWRYWVGSWHVFETSPTLGVGYAAFAQPYLAHRLPEAAEEIIDPHNLFVRLAVELGWVGLLAGVIGIALAAWAMTRPVLPETDDAEQRVTIMSALRVSALFVIASSLASIDFNAGDSFVTVELIMRILYGGLLALGIAAATIRSTVEPWVDSRPAPWIVAGAIVAAGTLLLQSMFDMVILETGVLMITVSIVGAVCGLRAMPRRRLPLASVVIVSVPMTIATLAMAVLIVVPVVRAELASFEGDRLLSEGRFEPAARAYARAFELAPARNVEFAMRVVAAAVNDRRLEPLAIEWINKAVSVAPDSSRVRQARARLQLGMSSEPGFVQAGLDDFRRAVELDPQSISLRIELADLLERFGRPGEAAAQIEAALAINDAYSETESERLSPDTVARLRDRLARLRNVAGPVSLHESQTISE